MVKFAGVWRHGAREDPADICMVRTGGDIEDNLVATKGGGDDRDVWKSRLTWTFGQTIREKRGFTG